MRAPLQPDRRLCYTLDSFYLPLQDGGALFHSHGGQFTISGRSAYALIERLSPFLTGEHTAADIAHKLDERQRAAVQAVLDKLWQRGVLTYADPPSEPELDAATAARFAQQIAFIDHRAGDGARRFLAYRRSRIVCVGRGQPVIAAVAALLDSGMARMRVLLLSREPDERAEIERIRSEYAAEDPGIEVDAIATEHPEIDGLDLAGTSCLVYAADVVEADVLLAMQRRCMDAGIGFLPLLVHAGRGLVGPLVTPASCCWECAWRRMQSPGPPGPAAGPLTRLGTAILGHTAAFALLNHLTSAGRPSLENEIVDLDPLTYETRRHHVMSHPLCDSCRGRRVRPEPPTITRDATAMLEHVAERVDRRFGVLIELAGGELDELMVSQCRIVAADATGFGGSGTLPAIRVVGVDPVPVRQDAIRAAIEQHCLSAGAARHAIRCAITELPDPACPPETLMAGRGSHALQSSDNAWIRAVRMSDGQTVWIPRAAVYGGASPGELHRDAAAIARGLGSGLTQEEALTRALLAAWSEHAAAAPPESWAWRALPEDQDRAPSARYYLDLLAQEHVKPDVMVASHGARLHACAIYEGQRRVCLAVHVEPSAAVEHALGHHVARVLARDHDGPTLGTCAPPGDGAWERWAASLRLATQEFGQEAYLVDLDPERHVSELMPHILACVLGRRSRRVT